VPQGERGEGTLGESSKKLAFNCEGNVVCLIDPKDEEVRHACIRVCACVCVCVCVQLEFSGEGKAIHTHAHGHTQTRAPTLTFAHAHARTYTHTHTHTHTNKFTYVCGVVFANEETERTG